MFEKLKFFLEKRTTKNLEKELRKKNYKKIRKK